MGINENLDAIGKNLDKSMENLKKIGDKLDQLRAENKLLKDLLARLYDYASIEQGGEWIIDDKGLQKEIDQALTGDAAEKGE